MSGTYRHPEQRWKEIFIGDICERDISLVGWKTKRLGKMPFKRNSGKDDEPDLQAHKNGIRPLFAKEKEVRKKRTYKSLPPEITSLV